MKQILHIFRKDLRHLWPEVALSLLLTALFAWIYPYSWMPQRPIPLASFGNVPSGLTLGTIAEFITGAVPVLWFVSISRVVQQENLVSIRQYWLTKPYEWQLLLAEKFLFISLCTWVPLLAAQCWLLHRAGLPPLFYVPGLLFNLLLVLGILVLPLFALATVTATFWRSFLALLMVTAGIALFAVAAEKLPSADLSVPYSDVLSLPLVLIVCGAVIVVQYSTRSHWLARGVLAVLLLTVAVLAINPLQVWMLETDYPQVPALRDLSLRLAADPDRKQMVIREDDKYSTLTIPLDIAGVPYGMQIVPNDLKLTIQTPGIAPWTSHWQPIYSKRYGVSTRLATVSPKVPNKQLERFKDKPVTLRLELALTEYEDGQPLRTSLPASGDLNVPDFGRCAYETDEITGKPALHCLYALHKPARTRVSALWTTAACDQPHGVNSDALLSTETGGDDREPAEFGLTSVWDEVLNFSYSGPTDTLITDLPRLNLCPGTTLTFTAMKVHHRARLIAERHDVQLPQPSH